MALFLARAAGPAGVSLPANPPGGFTDAAGLPEGTVTAINQMADLGVMPGFSGTVFSPYTNVTRAQMAFMLDAFLGEATIGLGAFAGEVYELSEVSPDDDVFDDIGQVTRGEYSAIRRMFEVGVARGTSDDSFSPQGFGDACADGCVYYADVGAYGGSSGGVDAAGVGGFDHDGGDGGGGCFGAGDRFDACGGQAGGCFPGD